MKRNKPLFKQRKPGRHWRMRRKSRNYYGDYDRRAESWCLYVPQSVVGADARTFDMDGAVPAGSEGDADSFGAGSGLYRWKLHRNGKTVTVYTSYHGHLDDAVPGGDVWYVFTAKGKCQRSNCPMTRYYCTEIDYSLTHHRPGTCPLGIPLDGSWKFARRKTL